MKRVCAASRARTDRRRIVAIGGGGFSSPPGDPALDRYVLEVADEPRPRICLLPTASGDPEGQISAFYRAYSELDCEASHLSLFGLATRPVDLRATLLAQDVVYVGCGSLLNLLAIWRAHGVDTILREAWARGVVLAGISAGSLCWLSAGVTKGFGRARAVHGLGLLPASNSVHHRDEPDRRPCFLDAIRTETVPPGYGVDDGAALLFAGRDLVEVVAARREANARWVEESGGRAVEVPLTAGLLAAETAAVPLDIAELRAAAQRTPARRRRVGGLR